jgi:hypothetical protein
MRQPALDQTQPPSDLQGEGWDDEPAGGSSTAAAVIVFWCSCSSYKFKFSSVCFSCIQMVAPPWPMLPASVVQGLAALQQQLRQPE